MLFQQALTKIFHHREGGIITKPIFPLYSSDIWQPFCQLAREICDSHISVRLGALERKYPLLAHQQLLPHSCKLSTASSVFYICNSKSATLKIGTKPLPKDITRGPGDTQTRLLSTSPFRHSHGLKPCQSEIQRTLKIFLAIL